LQPGSRCQGKGERGNRAGDQRGKGEKKTGSAPQEFISISQPFIEQGGIATSAADEKEGKEKREGGVAALPSFDFPTNPVSSVAFVPRRQPSPEEKEKRNPLEHAFAISPHSKKGKRERRRSTLQFGLTRYIDAAAQEEKFAIKRGRGEKKKKEVRYSKFNPSYTPCSSSSPRRQVGRRRGERGKKRSPTRSSPIISHSVPPPAGGASSSSIAARRRGGRKGKKEEGKRAASASIFSSRIFTGGGKKGKRKKGASFASSPTTRSCGERRLRPDHR